MPPLLPVQRDGRCGVHETAGAWRDTLFLQRPVQHMCAGRVCGESARLPRKLPVLSCSSALTVAHLHVFERWWPWLICKICRIYDELRKPKLNVGEISLFITMFGRWQNRDVNISLFLLFQPNAFISYSDPSGWGYNGSGWTGPLLLWVFY